MNIYKLREVLKKVRGLTLSADSEYISETENISVSDISDIANIYFESLPTEKFSEIEHQWILKNIAIHIEALEFDANKIKALCVHYLNSVQSHAESRIFSIMFLMMLDKYFNDSQSFVIFIFNQLKNANNAFLTQRETLMDLTDVLIDLGAIKHQEKALRILLVLSERNGITYVAERVLDLAIIYGIEFVEVIKGWIKK